MKKDDLSTKVQQIKTVNDLLKFCLIFKGFLEFLLILREILLVLISYILSCFFYTRNNVKFFVELKNVNLEKGEQAFQHQLEIY